FPIDPLATDRPRNNRSTVLAEDENQEPNSTYLAARAKHRGFKRTEKNRKVRKAQKSMRILISGAAGFLGSHLSDLLLSQGDDVVGVDNFITGKPQNIAHLKGNSHFQSIRHDVIEPLQVEGQIDRIYHRASPASPTGYVKHQVATLK